MSNVRPPEPADPIDDAAASDHDRAIAIIELAAAEPGGFARLDAGDTTDARWLAGHLAGCSACTSEYGAMRRLSGAVREVIVQSPPVELRARTLALVQSVGRERGGGARASMPEIPVVSREPIRRSGRLLPVAWLGGVAAAVVLSVGLTTAIVGGQVNEGLARERAATAALASVTRENIALLAQPDARVIGLTSSSSDASGSLLYSPGRGELSVTATGLAEPAAGGEYGCWLEIDGQRRRVGRMWFAGGIAYWAGPSAELSGLRPGSRFGVTLVAPDGTPAGDVLTGDL